MNRIILASFVFATIFVLSTEASVAQQVVKEGDAVEVDLFKGAKSIKRTVPAGEQIFHLDGANKGSFVDAKGAKVESSNYEAKNGILIIKKFSKADVGDYSEHPTKKSETKHDDGSVSAVPGTTLHLSLS
uniref:Uncharacterized protein n=1 Tax=Caenorhabditis japonica TaxID=281687 RepID=A0A8R1E1S5_CAEJA